MKMSFWRTFLLGYLASLRYFLSDKGLLPFFIVAPLLYGFYYPWSMSNEVVLKAPIAIVDYDNSAISRKIIQYAKANEENEVVLITNNELQVRQKMVEQEIYGYAVIPADLTLKVKQHKAVTVQIFAHASYALLNKSIANNLRRAVSAVSQEIAATRAVARGISPKQMATAYQPLKLVRIALFNPTQGYASYIVPLAFVLIFHQLVILGTATAIGTWSQNGLLPHKFASWLGITSFFCGVALFVGLVFLGWMLNSHDLPRGGNIWGTAIYNLLLIPTLCINGIAVGLFFHQREKAIYLFTFIGLPLFFMSGYPWPDFLLPELLRAVRWCIPLTSAIQANYKLAQLGCNLADVWFEIAALLVQCSIALTAACYLFNKNKVAFSINNPQ